MALLLLASLFVFAMARRGDRVDVELWHDVLLPLSQTDRSVADVAKLFDEGERNDDAYVNVWSADGALLRVVATCSTIDRRARFQDHWSVGLESLGVDVRLAFEVDWQPQHILWTKEELVVLVVHTDGGDGQVLSVTAARLLDAPEGVLRLDGTGPGAAILGAWSGPGFVLAQASKTLALWSSAANRWSFVASSREGMVEVLLTDGSAGISAGVQEVRLPGAGEYGFDVWAFVLSAELGPTAIVDLGERCAVVRRIEGIWSVAVELAPSPLLHEDGYQFADVRASTHPNGVAFSVITQSSPYPSRFGERYRRASFAGCFTASPSGALALCSWLVPGELSQDGWHGRLALQLAPRPHGAEEWLRSTAQEQWWWRGDWTYFAAESRHHGRHRSWTLDELVARDRLRRAAPQ